MGEALITQSDLWAAALVSDAGISAELGQVPGEAWIDAWSSPQHDQR